MDAERIEHRIRRLDKAIERTAQRAADLARLRDRYHDIVAGAAIEAEVNREQFVGAARIAFRDPYKALRSWERREWRLVNLAIDVPEEEDVPDNVQAAFEAGKGGNASSLMGRTRFGKDDPERLAAKDALSGMGAFRANWIRSLRRAQSFSKAVDRTGRQVEQLKNRLRNIGVRRAELLDRLFELKRPKVEPQSKDVDDRPDQSGSLGVREYVDAGLRLVTARRRRDRLDRAAARYLDQYELIKHLPEESNTDRPVALETVERRLAGYRTRRSELTATIVRHRSRLPEGVEVTDDEYADLKELHRAYRHFVKERINDARYPPDMNLEDRQRLDRMKTRTERLGRGIDRYRRRIATLSDPEFNVPEQGDPETGYLLRDPGGREAALSSLRRRLVWAEMRQRALREGVAARRVLQPGPVYRSLHWRDEVPQEMEREKRAEKERRRLDRLYRKERDRAKDLEPEI